MSRPLADGDDSRGASGKASYLLDVHRPQDALAVLTSALAERPEDADLLALVARAELDLGHADRALDFAQRAAAAAPDTEWPLRLQATAALRLGRHLEALMAAKQAVAQSPLEWQTHSVLAQVHLASGGNRTQAWVAARRATELGPNVAGTHVVMGQVAFAAGDPWTARRAAVQAMQLDPDHAAARNLLGRLDLLQSTPYAAAAHFAAAAAADPRETAPAHNVDVALTAALRRVTLIALLFAIVPGVAAATTRSESHVDGGILAALLALLLGYHAVHLRRALRGAALRAYLRQLPARSWALRWGGCLAVLGIGLLATLMVLPFGPFRELSFGVGVAAVFGGYVLAEDHRRRLRRLRQAVRRG